MGVLNGKVNWDAQDHEVMLYWELPEGEQKGDRYEIWVNGSKAGETGKTHFVLERLEADCIYEVCLCAVRDGEELQRTEFCCRTKKEKPRIDVTQAL